MLENILAQPIVHRLGWVLVHFIWQAALVAFVLALLLRTLRRSTANFRYIICCTALGLIVLLPVITMQLMTVSTSDKAADMGLDSATVVAPTGYSGKDFAIEMPVAGYPEEPLMAHTVFWERSIAELFEPVLPYIVLGWLVGVLGLSAWHLGGWAQLQRLRRKMVKQVDATIHSRLRKLAQGLGVNQSVQLMESALVQVPNVIGWLRPVILLPASALTGLSTEQLEAVLAHELAHIKRLDYLVNILQTVVETLGFYHPAVWWISRKISVERENCCDDTAARICGDRICYAEALTILEEIRSRPVGLVLAATGGSLFDRILRLVGNDSASRRRPSWMPFMLAILLVALLATPATFMLTAQAGTEGGSTLLYQAAADGNLKEVRSLISKGANVNAKDNQGRTPLFCAVDNGHSLVCDLLIAKGADVNAKDAAGGTPLHCAAQLVRHNDWRIAAELVRRGADVNAANKQGQTPLHIALQEGRTFPGKVAVMLLQYDVNVNTKDSNSKTALHLHTQRIVQNEGGSGSTLKAILAKGADVNLKDANGQSSLHIACEYNANRRDIIRAILGHGANVNIVDRDSLTPLHIAARRGQTDICEILVNSGATVNARDKHGHTPAYHAVRGGNIETANWLITKGADMSPIHLSAYQGNLSSLKSLLTRKASANEKDETGFTALHAAAAGGHRDTVEYLISQGADVEAEGGPGWTALSYAARGNHKEVVEVLHAKGAGGGKEVSRLLPPVIARGDGEMATILLASGADINFNNGEPLTTAVRCGHKEIVELLILKGADVNAGERQQVPLNAAAHSGRFDIAERLISAGANVNVLPAGKQDSPLEAAVDAKDIKMIEFLVSKGADVNKGGGWAPLHHAIHVESRESVELLIKHGADIDGGGAWSALGLAAWYVPSLVKLLIDSGGNVNAVAPQTGWTPLHWSAYGGNRKAFDLLVAGGADVNARTHKEETVLHLLVQWGREPDEVKFVLTRGVDINAADGGGWTALHRAVLYNLPEIVDLLIAEGADINLKDGDGRTPLWLAKEKGQKRIVELLQKHGAKE